MILVDSTVWIDFLRGKAAHGMTALLEENGVAMCGMVLSEVLSGVRQARQRDVLEARLCLLPYLEQTSEVHARAGRIYADLRRNGVTIPLSDCIIAAVCLANEVALLSTDKHFDLVSGITRARGVS